MNNRKWIWFDLDDTLYDFERSSLIGLDYIFKEYDLGRRFNDTSEWIDCYHRHNRALWTLYNAAKITQRELRRDRFVLPLTEAGFGAREAEELADVLDGVYLDRLGSTGLLVDGARPLLEQLRAGGYAIGLLSNGFTGVQHRKLESSGIAPAIDCVVLSDEIGINKPDRRIFDYALRKASATAADSVMVGDNPETDIGGALNAGWSGAVLFDPHRAAGSSDDAPGPRPTAIVDRLEQIPGCLGRITGRTL